MILKNQIFFCLFSILFCLSNIDLATAQIKQYKSYKVVIEGSSGEPDTTFKKTDIILDLNRDRISLLNPDETNIYNILLEMENKDEHDNYIRTFQVESRNGEEEFRFHFLSRGKDSEPELCIFEWREFGGITGYYHLE